MLAQTSNESQPARLAIVGSWCDRVVPIISQPDASRPGVWVGDAAAGAWVREMKEDRLITLRWTGSLAQEETH